MQYNTIYCMKFFFLVKMKNYFNYVKIDNIRIDNIKIIISILDATNSIIYRTDSCIQFNYIHFCMQIKLKNCIWLKIFFPDFFQKYLT